MQPWLWKGLADVGAWQNRPLGPIYPVIFFDAPRVKAHKVKPEQVQQGKCYA